MTDETDIRPTPPGRAPQTDLKEGAREAGSEVQRRAGEMRESARGTLRGAKAVAEDRTEAAKGQAADEIARTARGLEAAADELADAPLQQDLLREAADGLQQIARAVQGKSIGALVEDLSDFGRRNPVAYLGGAALAGFALARFARASAPTETGEYGAYTASTGRRYAADEPYGSGTTSQQASDLAGGRTATSPQEAADLAGGSRDG